MAYVTIWLVMPEPSPVVLAAVAHPDDIEFGFAGTLLLLKEKGCRIHMWNLADGGCGTTHLSRKEIVRIRREEAIASAALAGASTPPPFFPDLGIFYDKEALSAVAAVVRTIRPSIILTHAPSDYMEDHQNVCRLMITSAFSRSMPNFQTDPPQPCFPGPVRIYHAAPHGLRDGLGNPFAPDLIVDIGSVLETKARMLSCHRSQSEWLDASQGMGSYIEEMKNLCREMARFGRNLETAEVWRRHSHLGFCPADYDPLPELLADYCQPVQSNLIYQL